MGWNVKNSACGRGFTLGVFALGMSVGGTSTQAHADDCVLAPLIGAAEGRSGVQPTDIVVHGNFAYVSIFSSVIDIFDISTPTAPVKVGDILFQPSYSIPFDLEIHDDKLFVAISGPGDFGDGNRTLSIFDISDPASPALISNTGNLTALSIRVVDDLVYTLEGWPAENELSIIDASNPASPVVVSTTPLPSIAWFLDAVGSTVYLFFGDTGLHIYDVSDPTSPTLAGIYTHPVVINHVQVVGTTAYIADEGDGLAIVDVSDPSSPILIGSYQTGENLRRIHTDGQTLYGLCELEEMCILDVRDPSSVVELGRHFANSYIGSAEVVGTTAYFARQGGIDIIDVTNACDTVCIADFTGDGKLNFFDVSVFLSLYSAGDSAVDLNGDGVLNIFDISLFIGMFGAGCP